MESGIARPHASPTCDGATFSPNKRADDSIVSSKQIEPAVAVSASGTIYLTWQDNRWRTLDYDIFFSYSTDDGETFSPNVKVDDSNETISWQERPSIAVTQDGYIHIAWTDDRTRPLRVRGCTSTDGGAIFSASEEIVPSGASPSGQTGVSLIAAGDRILATFMDNMTGVPNPYICVSDDGGQTFSVPVRLDSTGSSGATQRGVTMTLLPGNGVLAAWEDQRNGNWDIYAVYVSADGTVSGTDFRVDDDTTNAYQRNPSIASDQLGNVYAIWEDERDNSFAVRFAYLVSGGRQFSASTEVATPGSDDMQRRPTICCTAPGHVYVSWQDDRAGSYDIYSSAGYVPELDLEIPEFPDLLVPIVGVVLIAVSAASRRRREVG